MESGPISILLPEDVLVLICAHCSVADISSLASTNKLYHEIISNNARIWRRAWRNSGFVRVRTVDEKRDPDRSAPKSSAEKYYNRLRECATSRQNMRRGAAPYIADLGAVDSFIQTFSKGFPSNQMAACAVKFAANIDNNNDERGTLLERLISKHSTYITLADGSEIADNVLTFSNRAKTPFAAAILSERESKFKEITVVDTKKCKMIIPPRMWSPAATTAIISEFDGRWLIVSSINNHHGDCEGEQPQFVAMASKITKSAEDESYSLQSLHIVGFPADEYADFSGQKFGSRACVCECSEYQPKLVFYDPWNKNVGVKLLVKGREYEPAIPVPLAEYGLDLSEYAKFASCGPLVVISCPGNQCLAIFDVSASVPQALCKLVFDQGEMGTCFAFVDSCALLVECNNRIVQIDFRKAASASSLESAEGLAAVKVSLSQ